MEQKLKEGFKICKYSTQEPDGMNKHANFLRFVQWKSPMEQLQLQILYTKPDRMNKHAGFLGDVREMENPN